jgi:hypothetical protein
MKTDLKKTIRTAALIGAVTSSIEGDHQICIKSPALVHGTSVRTIFFCSSQGYQDHMYRRVLDGVLNVVQEQLEERLETSVALAKMIKEKIKSFLGNITAMMSQLCLRALQKQKIFFIIYSRKVQIYIADTRFQGRNQEKHMVIWL